MLADKGPLRFVIIGAGMAGMLAGIRLKERGDTNFTIYEKGDSVGGTWRENSYPGLACDTPAHSYTYSFGLSFTINEIHIVNHNITFTYYHI